MTEKAVRIIHKVDCGEHSNRRFIKSGLLKLKDLVELQTLVMFRAKNRILPENLQKLFVFSSEDEEHGRKFHFKNQFAWTTLNQTCVSVVGVKFWNSLQNDLKTCMNIFKFKKMLKEKIIRIYETSN